MNTQLFEGELIRLAPPDPDRDAEVESKWTHDAEYVRLLSADPVRPLSPTLIKKKYEEVEKEKATQSIAATVMAPTQCVSSCAMPLPS